MRIYQDRFYVLAVTPGISGFQRWHERELHIVTGRKARNNRLSVVGEWSPKPGEEYIIHDGHTRDYCPRGDADAVRAFLASNPFGIAEYPDTVPA